MTTSVLSKLYSFIYSSHTACCLLHDVLLPPNKATCWQRPGTPLQLLPLLVRHSGALFPYRITTWMHGVGQEMSTTHMGAHKTEVRKAEEGAWGEHSGSTSHCSLSPAHKHPLCIPLQRLCWRPVGYCLIFSLLLFFKKSFYWFLGKYTQNKQVTVKNRIQYLSFP